MKLNILVFIIIIFAHKTIAQEFWEYVGLEGFFIANITQDNSGRLYSTEWQGYGDSVFFSDDFGISWFSYGEISDSFYISISSILFLENSDILTAGVGSTTGGIYKSTDSSKIWERKVTGASISSVTKLITSSDSIYASIYDGVYISIDEGESWNEIASKPDSSNEIIDIVISKDGKIFAATFGEIFRSTDNGLTWELVTNGIPPSTNFFMNLTISEEGYIYLGTRRLGIYRTKDMGENWEHIRHGWIRYVTTKPGGYLMAGAEQEGLILSTDHGDTWQIINSGLPGILPYTSFINSVYFDRDGYAYCSVHNFGIYRSALPVSVNHDEENFNSDSYILFQNYPNPFNPSTTITYYIPENSNVTLKVYDILGKEIAVLVNEERSAGTYKIEFNGSNLPSGIYFYRFIAGDFTATKKLILLK